MFVHEHDDPKKASHCQIIKNRIKSYVSLTMRLNFFVKLKYQYNIITL